MHDNRFGLFAARVIPALVLALAGAALLGGTPALAQYIYLDANGDGVHTAADVLAPSGSTTLEVWLKTDTNRDGSPVTCVTGEALTIYGYDFNLRATNGAVTWGAFTNLLPAFTLNSGVLSSATEYHNGFGGVYLPPGAYHLGTLGVSPAGGTPSLAFVAVTNLPGGGSMPTSFGSECSGVEFDYLLKLGSDWFDADGVEYGGTPQVGPVLAAIADMTVNEAATATQTITASDADGQALAFQKVSGPAYMSVATSDPGTGTATGTIRLTPGFSDAGSAAGTVSVTDQFLTDQRAFAITVLPTARPITIVVPEEVSVNFPGTSDVDVFISSPDGDRLHIEAAVAPEYARVDRRSGVTTYHSQVSLRPSLCDVEGGFLVMQATDEIYPAIRARATTRVNLSTSSSPVPPPPPDLFAATFTALPWVGPVDAMASGDLDGDGLADVVAACEAAGVVDVYKADPAGNLTRMERFTGGSVQGVAVADLDGDGSVDLCYLDGVSGELVVVRGPLNGASPVAQRVSVGPNPVALTLARMDGDARPDAIVTTSGGFGILVLLNQGDGMLASPRSYESPTTISDLAVADVTGDGALDVVTARRNPNVIETRANDGDGVLLAPIAHAAQTRTFYIAAGDFNRDGKADLVRICEPQDIQILLSTGTGAFVDGDARRIGAIQAPVLVADMNRDGIVDLIHLGDPLHIRIGRGDGTFAELKRYPTPSFLVSLALPDFDRDGAPDPVGGVTTGTSGAIAVYHNRGDGSLEPNPTTIGTGQGRLLVDVNNDSRLDLVTYQGAHLGLGDGTFGGLAFANLGTTHGSLIVADLTQDGKPDVVGVMQDGAILVHIGNGNGGFTPAGPTIQPGFAPGYVVKVAVADVSGDGIPDLLAGAPYPGNPGAGPIALWLGNGNGTFGARGTILGSDVVCTLLRVWDLDGDGTLEVISNDFRGGLVALSANGDGSFGPRQLLLTANLSIHTPTGIDFGDLNGDGLDDLTISTYGGITGIATSLQRPDHTFSPARMVWALESNSAPYDQVNLADFDGDGHPDLAYWLNGMVAVGLGDGQGAFGLRRYFNVSYGNAVPVLVGDVTSDGRPDIVCSGGGSNLDPIRVLRNRSILLAQRAALAFQVGGPKTVPVGGGGPGLCINIEPVGGSFQITDLDPASIVMRSEGTGSVSEISAVPPKRSVLGDADGNGVPDVQICFASADLGKLFSNLHGRQSVFVTIEGRLPGIARAHAELAFTIVPTGASTAPQLSPNPMNPTGTFRFATTRDGRARIAIYDVQGRLVRILVDRLLPRGDQTIIFDGKDRSGHALASGIYLATIETVNGTYRRRVAIVK